MKQRRTTPPTGDEHPEPSPKLGKLSGPLPRGLIVASVAVPTLILLLILIATALPYPPDPSRSIIQHLLGS